MCGTHLSLGICDDLACDSRHVGHCIGDDRSGGEGTEVLGLRSQRRRINLSINKEHVQEAQDNQCIA